MTALDALLAVQELDTRLDQLAHRHAALPERRACDELRAARTDLGARADSTAAELRRILADQKEAEDHASLLEDKVAEIQGSLYDGSVTSHKELESLQAEQVLLSERQRGFEDEALEQMELAEPVQARHAAQSSELDTLDARLADAEAALTVAAAEVEAELDAVRAERAAAAAEIDPAVLERYESLRAGLGGIAVARLDGGRCDGCHLAIPSAQLEGLRRAPDDEMITCPECARLLVR